MTSSHGNADLPYALRTLARALSVHVVCAIMLLSSMMVLSGGASSDPTVVNNPDDTMAVTWEFDEAADYDLTDAVLSGGDALLGLMNATDGDGSEEDYALGTVSGLDISSVPGTATVDEGDSVFLALQPDADGKDAYLAEAKINDNYGGALDLVLDSEINKMMRIVIWFDLSSVPSEAAVSDATLWLYLGPGSKGADVEFNVHMLSKSFAESEVTWAKNTASTMWDLPGGDYGSYPYCTATVTNTVGWVGMDVSRMVERWVSGVDVNRGMILVPVPTGGDNQKVFQSSDDNYPSEQRPKLLVNYTVQGGVGILESRPLGPGTNATFTQVTYSNSTVSRLDDAFLGSGLSDKWAWVNDPTLSGGTYDVGTTRPGWLHVSGSANSQLQDTVVTCNYAYQDVTGDFQATTYLEDYFTVNSMGAGLLLHESDSDWVYLGKMDPGASGRVQVVLCENGTSATAGTLSWTGYSSAHLKVVRQAGVTSFYASTDGDTWQLAYQYAPVVDMLQSLRLGLFVFSSSSTRPVVDFDHFTVVPLTAPSFELRVRTGNSTDTSDPSWVDWASAQVLTGPAVLMRTGMYLQYRMYMSTGVDWCTPSFSGLDCWYEMYPQSGIVQTEDHVPADFSMWYTLTTDETPGPGTVDYYYSTDHGSTWVHAGRGGSYSITSTEESLMVRMVLQTYDTLGTPRVHSVSAVHGTAVMYLLVVAPTEVVAGEAFPVTIYAKDSSDATMVHWSGPITMTAMHTDAATPMDTELAIPSATVTSGGYVTVPNQMYTEAATILIRATAQEAYGFSTPITVSPAPISTLRITPAVDTLIENTYQTFDADARDAYDNSISDLEFGWSVDGPIGTLNRMTGESVTLRTSSGESEGYLNLSGGGMQASQSITVVHEAHAPSFSEEVPDQTRYEDSGSWTVDLAPYITDAVHADDELRWFVTNETIVEVSGENRTGNMMLTLSTVQDLHGTEVLGLHVVDPDGLSASTNFTVAILPVNDWPTIDVITPLVVHMDILYVYNMRYYVHDVDNTESQLTLTVDDESAPFVSASRLTLQILYPAELNGTTQTVVVTVSDGLASASTVVQVTVSDDSVPVVVDFLPSIEMYQGETVVDVFDLDSYFFDPDDDVLYYAYGYNHVLVNISDDHTVSLFAPTDWYGTEYVIFSAIDPEGARVESATTVVVHRVNQAPTIGDVPDLVVRYDLRYEFDLTRYVSDPDNDLDDLYVTADDVHVVPAGLVLTIEYPEAMDGESVIVMVTVSDGELSDCCMVNITVGDNTPPTAEALPPHSFQEDLPVRYPSSGELGSLFHDEEGEDLDYEVFVLSAMVGAAAEEDEYGDWTVSFTTAANWYGTAWFVVRATDPGGALVETMAELTVHSVPDSPVLRFNETVTLQTGVQRVLDLYASTQDPDMHTHGMVYTVSGDNAVYATVIEGVLVLEFPDEFLEEDEESRSVGLTVSVTDPDGLHDTETLALTVVRTPDEGRESWLLAGMAAMAVIAAGSFIVAMRLRKKPFVIKDIMLVHNDGFLIGRAAEKQEGEIDEDVLSGMLTAVLNFVEDSMGKTQDGLRSFGFDRYKVLVKRGRLTYMAVVHEGDAPEAVDERLEAFLVKVEKIYRKRIENWTGDMDTDFAGIEVLLQSFVKENSRKGGSLNGGFGANGRNGKDGNGSKDGAVAK